MTNDYVPTLRIEAKNYGGDFLEIDIRKSGVVKVLVDSTRISENSEYVLLDREQFDAAMDTLGYFPKPEPTFAERMDAAPVGTQIIRTQGNDRRIYQKIANGTWAVLNQSGYPSENFSDTMYAFVKEEVSE